MLGRNRMLAAALAGASAITLGACAKKDTTPKASNSSASQLTQAPSSTAPAPATSDSTSAAPKASDSSSPAAAGEGCTIDKYGAAKADLTKDAVGFSQSEAIANPFRKTETDSITATAKEKNVKLEQSNADSKLPKQNADIQDLLNKGAKFLIVAPLDSKGLTALNDAKAKKVPVLTIDRKVEGEWCKDFITFIGSDFLQQGKRAAMHMGKALNGKGEVIELEGAPGNNVAKARKDGFDAYMKANFPDIKIVASQTGEWNRDKGQAVAETLLKANPGVTGIYAHNDEMAFGAVNALKGANKKAGKDVQIVSIDGIPEAIDAAKSGLFYADIETNANFGPLAFQTADDFFAGKPIPEQTIIVDRNFDKDHPDGTLDDLKDLK